MALASNGGCVCLASSGVSNTRLWARPSGTVSGKVKVVTGGKIGPFPDHLESGVLEASADAKTWTKVAEFKDGRAEGAVPAGTTSLRIRVTKSQESWFTIGEIVVE